MPARIGTARSHRPLLSILFDFAAMRTAKWNAQLSRIMLAETGRPAIPARAVFGLVPINAELAILAIHVPPTLGDHCRRSISKLLLGISDSQRGQCVHGTDAEKSSGILGVLRASLFSGHVLVATVPLPRKLLLCESRVHESCSGGTDLIFCVLINSCALLVAVAMGLAPALVLALSLID